jgi:DNA-binding XRE family transcriptional regulator
MTKYNLVKMMREKQGLSKAELARRSGVSIDTVMRIEKNLPCRIESKRKILLGLGFDIRQKDEVFPRD